MSNLVSCREMKVDVARKEEERLKVVVFSLLQLAVP